MDFSMNDGLYSRFQTWKIACSLILDSEYSEVAETRKVNTLLRWSGDFGIQKLRSWKKEPKDLNLQEVWDEFESYCKPQANELRARYDLLKTLKQGQLPCDDWLSKLEAEIQLCGYGKETETTLMRDLFLFGLENESFMSRIISEEPNTITTAQIRQKLKKLESGKATAKYIKQSTNTSVAAPAQVHQVTNSHRGRGNPGQKRRKNFQNQGPHQKRRDFGEGQQKPQQRLPQNCLFKTTRSGCLKKKSNSGLN